MRHGREWETLIRSFFSRSTYCSPDVLRAIVDDLSLAGSTFSLSLQAATWGTTQQQRLCLYGGLSIHNKMLPIQVWLTYLYPVDPPTIFTVSPELGINAEDGVVVHVSAVVKTPHPNVDNTGLCYCAALSRWNPQQASLVYVLQAFTNEIAQNGFPIIYARSSQRKMPTSAQSSIKKPWKCVVCYTDTNLAVLVPCGHLCCCQSCANNLPVCPLCRMKIEVRQLVLDDNGP